MIANIEFKPLDKKPECKGVQLQRGVRVVVSVALDISRQAFDIYIGLSRGAKVAPEDKSKFLLLKETEFRFSSLTDSKSIPIIFTKLSQANPLLGQAGQFVNMIEMIQESLRDQLCTNGTVAIEGFLNARGGRSNPNINYASFQFKNFCGLFLPPSHKSVQLNWNGGVEDKREQEELELFFKITGTKK